jgi:peptide/nickel transport system substrate-binding protein
MTRRVSERGRISRVNAWITALALVGLFAHGCGGGDGGEQVGAESEPAHGDMLVVAFGADADILLPQISNSAEASDIQNQIFWYLMRSKADFINVEPALADSYRFSADSLAIDFFINPQARWHDGHPVHAEDVVFAHEVCLAPEVNFAAISWLDHITAVEAVDSLTVRFRFDTRYMYQVQDANVCHPLPKHILENVPMGDLETHPYSRAPVGSGPFRFVSWTPGQEIVVEANTEFFRGRPYLNRVTYRVIPEPTTRATQVQNGSVDIWSRVPPTFYPQLSQDPDLEIESYPGRTYTYQAYNTKDPIVSDKRVRQALTLAINRQQLVDALLHGQGVIGTQPMISTIWAHDSSIEPWPFDAERAQQLLEDAGWTDQDGDGVREKDGRPLRIEIKTNSDNQMRVDIATVVQDQWKRVGVDARLTTLEFNTFIDQLLAHDFQTAVAGWSVGIKAELSPTFGSGQPFNFPSVENARLDSLIRVAEVERDRERAKQIWSEAQRLIVDEAYYTFLFQQNELHALDQRFQGVEMTPYGWDHYLERWYVPEGRQKYNVPIGAPATAGAGADTTGGARAR